MITYEPFWNTLRKSSESTYTLIRMHKFSSATINRLRQKIEDDPSKPRYIQTVRGLGYRFVIPQA